MASHATSLALALSGFSVDAASEGSEAPQARPAVAAAAAPAPNDRPAAPAASNHPVAAAAPVPGASDRPVAAGAAALVNHASLITNHVLERWQAPGYSAEQDGEQLSQLCFALQSTVGQRGRLSEADERAIFQLASALWAASLQALAAPGSGSGGGAMSAALERLGNELFALVDGDSDNTQDCARCEEEAGRGCWSLLSGCGPNSPFPIQACQLLHCPCRRGVLQRPGQQLAGGWPAQARQVVPGARDALQPAGGCCGR